MDIVEQIDQYIETVKARLNLLNGRKKIFLHCCSKESLQNKLKVNETAIISIDKGDMLKVDSPSYQEYYLKTHDIIKRALVTKMAIIATVILDVVDPLDEVNQIAYQFGLFFCEESQSLGHLHIHFRGLPSHQVGLDFLMLPSLRLKE